MRGAMPRAPAPQHFHFDAARMIFRHFDIDCRFIDFSDFHYAAILFFFFIFDFFFSPPVSFFDFIPLSLPRFFAAAIARRVMRARD